MSHNLKEIEDEAAKNLERAIRDLRQAKRNLETAKADFGKANIAHATAHAKRIIGEFAASEPLLPSGTDASGARDESQNQKP